MLPCVSHTPDKENKVQREVACPGWKSWLLVESGVEPKKRKSVTVSTFSPSICHEVMGLDAMILVF